jgi:hypothetical protein
MKAIVDIVEEQDVMFPLELNKDFSKMRKLLTPLLDINVGDKIGKDSAGNYIIFSRGYGFGGLQLIWRKLYSEDRKNTNKYLEDDFTLFAKFLDKIVNFANTDLLNIYKTFGYDVARYCQKLIASLYNLKKTYDDKTDNAKNIVARIDSIIMILIEYKENIETIYVNKHNGHLSCYMNMQSSSV